jgi:hypothetical protein
MRNSCILYEVAGRKKLGDVCTSVGDSLSRARSLPLRYTAGDSVFVLKDVCLQECGRSMESELDGIADVPDALQGLYPFFARGREVAHIEPVVSYFTRLYAVEQGLGIRRQLTHTNEQKRIAAFLSKEMNDLEALKARILSSREWSSIFRHTPLEYLHRFASRIFERAEKESISRKPAPETAAKFYAASIFLQALEQFRGREDSETSTGGTGAAVSAEFWDQLSQQIRYAQYKCVMTRRALRESTQDNVECVEVTQSVRTAPVPDKGSSSSLGKQNSTGVVSPEGSDASPQSVDDDESPPPTSTHQQCITSRSQEAFDGAAGSERQAPASLQPLSAQSPNETSQERKRRESIDDMLGSPGNGVTAGTRHAFRRHVRSALSAAEFDDDETAVKELQQALALLTGQRSTQRAQADDPPSSSGVCSGERRISFGLSCQ